jgi:hypothetical protein
MARRKEIAVRLSLGAPTWRLIRQLLAESGVLALLGGLSSLLLAYWGRDLLWSFRPSGMRADFLDLSGLAVMYVNAVAQGYSPQRGMQFYRDVVERVRQLPGVQSASWGEGVPQFSGQAASPPRLPGGPRAFAGIAQPVCAVQRRLARLFHDVGIPILRGRDFTEADRERAELVAINETCRRRSRCSRVSGAAPRLLR